MFRYIFWITVFVTLLVTGCGAVVSPPAESNSLSLEGEWTIRMAQSGGIMGLSRKIEIHSDGNYIVTDERTDKTVNGKLSEDKLSKLQKLVDSSKYIQPIPLEGFTCADCFIYDLEITGSNNAFSAQLNDMSLPNSGLEALATELRSTLESVLK